MTQKYYYQPGICRFVVLSSAWGISGPRFNKELTGYTTSVQTARTNHPVCEGGGDTAKTSGADGCPAVHDATSRTPEHPAVATGHTTGAA